METVMEVRVEAIQVEAVKESNLTFSKKTIKINKMKSFQVIALMLVLILSGCSLQSKKTLTQTPEGDWMNQSGDFTDEKGEILSTFDNNHLNSERE